MTHTCLRLYDEYGTWMRVTWCLAGVIGMHVSTYAPVVALGGIAIVDCAVSATMWATDYRHLVKMRLYQAIEDKLRANRQILLRADDIMYTEPPTVLAGGGPREDICKTIFDEARKKY